ncbi:MAG: acyl carrier protein [Tissierellia bacterium]|nr:acyl carrier protein [Tissierellia bacterium]
MEDLRAKVYQLIAQQFNKEVEELTDATSFKEDLNADSLDLVELVMTMEVELGLEAEDGDLEDIKTVGDCIHYVEKLK